MNTAKAIEILESEWKKSVGDYRYQNAQKIDLEYALDDAIAALRKKAEQERIHLNERGAIRLDVKLSAADVPDTIAKATELAKAIQKAKSLAGDLADACARIALEIDVQ